MACFIFPAVAGVTATALKKKIPEHLHPEWLNAMLWGGVATLVVEHYAHGEIVPHPPFLTAMKNPQDIPQMLKEVVTVGGTMTLVIVTIWLIAVALSRWLTSHKPVPEKISGGG